MKKNTSYLVNNKYLQGHLMQSPFWAANSKISLSYVRSMAKEGASRQELPDSTPQRPQ